MNPYTFHVCLCNVKYIIIGCVPGSANTKSMHRSVVFMHPSTVHVLEKQELNVKSCCVNCSLATYIRGNVWGSSLKACVYWLSTQFLCQHLIQQRGQFFGLFLIQWIRHMYILKTNDVESHIALHIHMIKSCRRLKSASKDCDGIRPCWESIITMCCKIFQVIKKHKRLLKAFHTINRLQTQLLIHRDRLELGEDFGVSVHVLWISQWWVGFHILLRRGASQKQWLPSR